MKIMRSCTTTVLWLCTKSCFKFRNQQYEHSKRLNRYGLWQSPTPKTHLSLIVHKLNLKGIQNETLSAKTWYLPLLSFYLNIHIHVYDILWKSYTNLSNLKNSYWYIPQHRAFSFTEQQAIKVAQNDQGKNNSQSNKKR